MASNQVWHVGKGVEIVRSGPAHHSSSTLKSPEASFQKNRRTGNPNNNWTHYYKSITVNNKNNACERGGEAGGQRRLVVTWLSLTIASHYFVKKSLNYIGWWGKNCFCHASLHLKNVFAPVSECHILFKYKNIYKAYLTNKWI